MPNLYYMPFFVYILHSLVKDNFYIGYTSDLEARIILVTIKKVKVLLETTMIGKSYIQKLMLQNLKLWREKNKSNLGKAEVKFNN